MTYFDTETVGFHGPIVLYQYAIDDGPVNLWSVFYESIDDTLDLIQATLLDVDCVMAFNISFDWFHICQTYTTLLQLRNLVGGDAKPFMYLDEYVQAEKLARGPGTPAMRNPCLKPKMCFDPMIHAKTGEFSYTMRRKPIRLRRIPAAIAKALCKEIKFRLSSLEVGQLLKVNVKVMEPKGSIKTDPTGVPLSDIEILFKGTAALKPLAATVLCRPGGPLEGKQVIVMNDVKLHKKFQPIEKGYDPVNQPISGWRTVIGKHLETWCFNAEARQYATDDVIYLRALYKEWKCPPPGDVNSTLACLVGAVRWRGYKVNLEKMQALRLDARRRKDLAPLDPGRVREWLYASLDPMEREILASYKPSPADDPDEASITKLKESTKRAVLEMLRDDELWAGQEVSKRAGAVLAARKAKKELELYNKFHQAKQFHASAKVVGTLSNRMAGDNDLNAQGINKNRDFRGCFPLAYDDLILCGGDFSAFEVSLGDAVFDDPKMRELLQTGKKIAGVFGTYCYPGMTYEEIIATDGAIAPNIDYYTRSKSGFFAAILYGGDAGTLKRKLGIELENAQQGIDRMLGEFANVGACIRGTFSDFQSLSQVAGVGSKIEYTEPADFVETKLGFRRYFTLENTVIKILFGLAQDLPDRIRRAARDIRVIRNAQLGREQSGDGACMTALYAAAFGLQGFVQRAANNHKIQAFGADLTKRLQVALWELQPPGENEWIVQPMNIHDEIMCPTSRKHTRIVRETVERFIKQHTDIVPCLKIDWLGNLPSWAAKGSMSKVKFGKFTDNQFAKLTKSDSNDISKPMSWKMVVEFPNGDTYEFAPIAKSVDTCDENFVLSFELPKDIFNHREEEDRKAVALGAINSHNDLVWSKQGKVEAGDTLHFHIPGVPID